MKKGVAILACALAWYSMAFTAEQAIAPIDDRVEQHEVQNKKTFIENTKDPIRKVMIGLAVATAVGALLICAKYLIFDSRNDKYSNVPAVSTFPYFWWNKGK